MNGWITEFSRYCQPIQSLLSTGQHLDDTFALIFTHTHCHSKKNNVKVQLNKAAIHK